MDRIIFIRLNRSALVDWISSDVKHTPHDTVSDRHVYWAAAIHNVKAAFKTFGSGHRDCANQLVPKMLLNFECQIHWLILNPVFNSQGVIDPRQSVIEFHVHNRTDDLNDFAFTHVMNLVSINAQSNDFRSSGLTAGNLQQLVRDIALTQLVVFDRQVFDQSIGIIRGVLH